MARRSNKFVGKSKEKTPTAPLEIKIQHHRSPQFTSHHATGAVLSGPSGDGMYHLIFHADAIGITAETGDIKKDVTEDELKESMGFSSNENVKVAAYKTKVDPDDIETFREDKVRVSVPYDCLLSIRDLLNRKHPPEEKEKDETKK